jgi:hypothetical protein
MFAPQTNGESTRFSRPADYYSSPTAEPVVPAWARYGCGAAAAVILLLLFGVGAFLTSGGMSSAIDLTLGLTASEISGMYGSEVTPSARAGLDAELDSLREGLRAGRISVASIQPLLEEMRSSMADEHIDAKETARLTSTAARIARSAKR